MPTFRQAASAWLALLERRMSQEDDHGRPLVRPSGYRRHEQCIRRYLLPFFGDKPVTEINADDCDRWLEWRLHYYTEHEGKAEAQIAYRRAGKLLKRPARRSARPPDSTIQKDKIAFNGVIEHARLRMGISFAIVPKLSQPKEHRDNRRPRFTPQEWAIVSKALRERARDPVAKSAQRNGKSLKGGRLNAKSAWSRKMLNLFCHFLHGTGIRVSEAMYLQIRDIVRVPEGEEAGKAYAALLSASYLRDGSPHLGPDEREETIRKIVAARTEFRIEIRPDNPGLKQPIHARRVIPLPYMQEVIQVLLMHLVRGLTPTAKGDARGIRDLPRELWLWCDPSGRRIHSFSRGFDALLTDTQLLTRDAKKRSLTSIRHTYASERIEAGATAAGLTMLAVNMGTSTEMLRKHYAQVLHELDAASLQRTRNRAA